MDQGRLQKRPIKPKVEDPRQNPLTKKKHQNVAFGKRQNSGAKYHHRLPVVLTTARGGGGTAVLPGTHGCGSPLPPTASIPLWLSDFLRDFFRFWLEFCL